MEFNKGLRFLGFCTTLQAVCRTTVLCSEQSAPVVEIVSYEGASGLSLAVSSSLDWETGNLSGSFDTLRLSSTNIGVMFSLALLAIA